MMYRTGLVPRRLAVLGLIGGPLHRPLRLGRRCSASSSPAATSQQLSAAPEFFWELGLGIYLIVKGFKTPAADVQGATGEPAVTR